MTLTVGQIRAKADMIRRMGAASIEAHELDDIADQIEELRAVLKGIVDLGGTMGSALFAETVDRAARRALAESE